MKVGFIGVGIMGAGMANNLQKAGHTMFIYDAKREAAQRFLDAGATWTDSPRALAEQSEVVFTSLPDPPVVEAVAYGDKGILAGLKKGAAWFDLTTNSVPLVRKLHADFKKEGKDFLDAPVSGGKAGAASGKLAIWVGGDKPVYDKFEAVMKNMADQARYVGPIGAGSIAKLVHNACSASIAAVQAEMFTMGIKAGLDPLALWEAVRQGSIGRARSFDSMSGSFLTGKYTPAGFALRLLHKDVSLAAQLGAQVGVPMRMAHLTIADLTEGLNRGWGETHDARALMAIQVERAGLKHWSYTPEAIKDVLDRDGK